MIYHLILNLFGKGSRNFDDSLKIALVASCAAANVSTNQVKIVFQKTSEIFFHQKYYTLADDIRTESNEQLEPRFKKPRTKEDYKTHYTFVLPSN